MTYHRESYPEEEVEVDVKEHRDQRNLHHVTAVVTHEDYGSVKVAYGFPKGQGWHEELDGTKKFMLKLKDMGLDKLTPEDGTKEIEKNAMSDKVLAESEKV